jgi:3-methyladenine DNA glycosylase AlkC
MQILNNEIERKITNCIFDGCINKQFDLVIKNIPKIIDELYANIPANKRIAFGRVYTIKILSKYLFQYLSEIDVPIFQITSHIFENGDDFKGRSVALGILSYLGLQDYEKVLPYFEAAANDENWDVREMSQMFFKKLIKKFPDQMKDYLKNLATSENPNIRCFVAETLRPVQENQWFYKNPDYPLSILRYLFKESAPYPRTAVGNNLSDLARQLPDLVYDLVKELVDNGDKNSYWIAYRACRSLVKNQPIKVMDLLKADEYKYKNRVHQRSDYQRN